MKAARNLAIALLLGAALAPAAAAPLATVTVAPANAARTYTAEGVVEAVRQSTIAAQVPARIVEVHVRAGDAVKAGQVLVHLDPRTAADQLASSHAQVAAAQAQLEAARKDFERNRRLFEKQYISQAAMEQAEAQYKAAQAQARATTAQAGVASTAVVVHDARGARTPASSRRSAWRWATWRRRACRSSRSTIPTELRVVAQLPGKLRAESRGRPAGPHCDPRRHRRRPRHIDAARVVCCRRPIRPPTRGRSRLALPANAQGLAPGMFVRAYAFR